MRDNEPLPPVATSEEEEKKSDEREAAPTDTTGTKKKRRSTTKKKRLSRNKSLDLSCPIMTMNKPNNFIKNKEKKWYNNKAIPPSSPDKKMVRASFTAMSLSVKEKANHNDDDHLINKSAPNFGYIHEEGVGGVNDDASKLVSSSDPCLSVEEGQTEQLS